MTINEAAKIMHTLKARALHSERFSMKDFPYTREELNLAENLMMGVMLRKADDGLAGKFEEFVSVSEFVEQKTGHRYELIYDHDEPNIAILMLREGTNEDYRIQMRSVQASVCTD